MRGDPHAGHLAEANERLGRPVYWMAAHPTAENLVTELAEVAQRLLEDTGVRAYKGRAGELLGTDLLTVALQIHSVEARHAAKIRVMRGQRAWVNPGDDLATHPIYTSGVTAGSNPGQFGLVIPPYSTPSPVENNTTQSGVPITTGLGTPYTAADAAASFDEYLQAAEVLDNSRAGSLIGA